MAQIIHRKLDLILSKTYYPLSKKSLSPLIKTVDVNAICVEIHEVMSCVAICRKILELSNHAFSFVWFYTYRPDGVAYTFSVYIFLVLFNIMDIQQLHKYLDRF